MYEGKCKFLVTKAVKAQHHQSKYIKGRNMDLVSTKLKAQIDYYKSRGLIMRSMGVNLLQSHFLGLRVYWSVCIMMYVE